MSNLTNSTTTFLDSDGNPMKNTVIRGSFEVPMVLFGFYVIFALMGWIWKKRGKPPISGYMLRSWWVVIFGKFAAHH